MYIDAQRKVYVVWKQRTNGNEVWLTKADAPSKVHPTEQEAFKEATRLAQETGETFIVMAAIARVEPIKVKITNLI